MRQRHALVLELELASSRTSMSIARGPWRTPPPRAELALERLDRVEQLRAARARSHPQARVEEARLVEHLADRVGVVGRGAARTSTPTRGSASTAACRSARRSPTFEPSPSSPIRARARCARSARVVAAPPPATFSPIACANGSSPEIGRSITVKSAIRPSSSKRSRSMPSISRPVPTRRPGRSARARRRRSSSSV